jgi:hypothetical protein
MVASITNAIKNNLKIILVLFKVIFISHSLFYLTAELAAPVLVELKYGDTILEKIKSDHKEEQITYLYALSDLVDVDRSGNTRRFN